LAFDDFLFWKKKQFSAVVIGGGALSLLDIITRETQDIDILDPHDCVKLNPTPVELAEAVV
jgi:hypothetical protein